MTKEQTEQIKVSIHAPTRGATQFDVLFEFAIDVSIHAPTRGATELRRAAIQAMVLFQSTHPHGVRLGNMYEANFSKGFNPRTHTGCDTDLSPRAVNDGRFQSTHPHGVRRNGGRTALQAFLVSIHAPTRGATQLCDQDNVRAERFNPRTHTGCDLATGVIAHNLKVSIHAPTRGATERWYAIHDGITVSIHAPTRDATRDFGSICNLLRVSIHAPTRGATRIIASNLVNRGVSIHAPTRGATSYDIVLGDFNKVSIHAPTRGATYQGVCLTAVKSVSIHAPTRGAT